jgi:hypothetical protein
MAMSKQCRYLKDRLIALAAVQVKAKRARKRLPEPELGALQRDVVERRVEISACLNLYHEIRGSAHRHGIPEGWQWRQESVQRRLREELAGLG